MSESLFSRRDMLKVAAVATAGTALAACQPQVVEKEVVVKETVVVKEAAKEPVTLRYSYWGFMLEKQGAIQHAFMDTHPYIRLKEEITGWGTYWQKMLTATAAGNAPDVMSHSPYYHVQFAANGVTLPLDAFVERDGMNLDEYYEGAINQGRWQKGQIHCGSGDLHVFPGSWHTGTTFFYNKNHFDEEGIPYPDDTWTWDDLVAKAGMFTVVDADGTMKRAGMDTPTNGNGWITNWIFSAGGQMFSDDYTKCLIKSSEAMESFKYCVDMVREQKVALAPEPGRQFHPFETGQVSMSLAGDWMMMSWQDIEDFDWNIFNPPKHPVTGLGLIDAYQNGAAVSTSSDYPDESWEFIKWRFGPPGLKVAIDVLGLQFSPHIPTAMELVYVKDRELRPADLWMLGEQLKTAGTVFSGPNPGEVSSIFHEEQDAAFLGVKTLEEAADSIESRVNKSLDKAAEDLLS